MICKHCLKEVTQYDPLGYCAQCGVWYKAEGEEIKGVYMLCSTREDNPEKCNLVEQSMYTPFISSPSALYHTPH